MTENTGFLWCPVLAVSYTHLDDLGGDTGYHSTGGHIADDHSTGGHHGSLANPAAFQHYGVGADDHIVLNDNRLGTGLSLIHI